jgi:hypothetical protein
MALGKGGDVGIVVFRMVLHPQKVPRSWVNDAAWIAKSLLARVALPEGKPSYTPILMCSIPCSFSSPRISVGIS